MRSDAPRQSQLPAPRLGAWRVWLETVLACAATFALMVATRDDHVALTLRPWFALVPTLVALKHGLAPACLALFAWVVAQPVSLDVLMPAALPVFTLTALAGLFRDHWHHSRAALRRTSDEQEGQLEELFRRYRVLLTSHAQIAQRLAAREWSLDTAVREAERTLSTMSFAQAASAVLELLVARGSVGAATFFASGAQLDAIASVGPTTSAQGSEHMLRAAIDKGSVVSADLASPHAWWSARLSVLVALPVITSDERVIGVIGVHELPFDLFNDEHVAFLSSLVLRLADVLGRHPLPEPRRTESGVHATAVVRARIAKLS